MTWLPAGGGPPRIKLVSNLAWPVGADVHEVHAPGVAATAQLGNDLWVAAAQRARPVVPTADVAGPLSGGPNAGLPSNCVLPQANPTSVPPNPPAARSTMAAGAPQTVPAFVETPDLALIPDDDEAAAESWVTNSLGNWPSMPNQHEIGRQLKREIRTCKHGRRDAQWALRRAAAHAGKLVCVETPLLAATTHGAGGPADPAAAVDLVGEPAGRRVGAHRKTLMAAHLGVAAGAGGGAPPSPVGAPSGDRVRLHQPIAAHEAFADVLAAGGLGRLLPLWSGPDPNAPGATIPHPPEVADPDGRGGANLVVTIAAALGGSTTV